MYDLYNKSSMFELLEAERARVLRRNATMQRRDEKIHDLETRVEDKKKKIEALEAELQ